MKRYLIVAALVGFVAFREYGDKLQLPEPQAASETVVDECCRDFAVRVRKFYADGSAKMPDFKSAADAEAFAVAGWQQAEREAFKPLDEREANAVYAKDWRAEFGKLWKEFAGE